MIAVDIDGVLTDSPLHWGGTRRIGRVVWGVLRTTRLAERIMRNAKPIPEAVEWLRWVDAQGIHVRYVTAREQRYRHLTVDWLRKHELLLPNSCVGAVWMRPAGTSVVTHKADCVVGCELYLEDQLAIAEAVDRRLAEQDVSEGLRPLIVHVTSWQLQERLLRHLIAEALRDDDRGAGTEGLK